MKRIDRIYQYIQEKSSSYQKENIKGRIGVEATEISDQLDILRSNVSRELNTLQRQGKIVKFIGRPVLYFDRECLEEFLGMRLEGESFQFSAIEDYLQELKNIPTKSAFDLLIGADSSLKKQVEQAKAAILYPPDGLHTLIVGQTGVGKTLFAHKMYEYGKTMGRFAPDAPFITFNCADYYNNPQLLLAHIFGHIKGAFTGADIAKAGLVESADTGILFLDEIHRLPPEGQEMIFYFMDTGTFNRLGETTRNRKAKVLIIGATTEDPASVLTKTFVRRIPSIIHILPLVDRSVEEMLEITKLLLADEAHRIHKPVKITVEAVKALIGSIGQGNVGQLKSNIKLLCAQAFLNGIDKPDYIEIDFKMLPATIKNGLLTLSADRQKLALLSQYVVESLFITPAGGKAMTKENEREHFNLYQVVEEKMKILKHEGIGDALIKQMVANDVNVYIKSFYNKENDVSLTTRERLLKIIDYDLVDFTEEIALMVQKRLHLSSQDRFLYAFSLHLSVFFKRITEHQPLSYNNTLGETQEQSAEEFQIALEIKQRIEAYYHIEVPPAEIAYFAMMLTSLKEEEDEEKIIIAVAMHGVNTASSMVAVAQKLFNTQSTNLFAFDMPLEVRPQEIFEKMIAHLSNVPCQKGILLLADMGSLCNFAPMITERLQVPVRTIDMVSTPLVLEAMRKSDIAGISLEAIYDSLKSFKGYEKNTEMQDKAANKDQEAIVTICTSGKGAATKLQVLVEKILVDVTDRQIQVLPVGVQKLEESLAEIAKTYKIIATVGMVKPKFDAPFIPLEKVIDGEIEMILRNLVGLHIHGSSHQRQPVEKKNLVLRNFCEESLGEMLTYLNPGKVIDTLLKFDEVLEEKLQITLSNPLRIRLIVHCGCALERMIMGRGLTYDAVEFGEIDIRKVQCVKEAAALFEHSIQVTLTEDEICFIVAQL